jgi:hypothetical protein
MKTPFTPAATAARANGEALGFDARQNAQALVQAGAAIGGLALSKEALKMKSPTAWRVYSREVKPACASNGML